MTQEDLKQIKALFDVPFGEIGRRFDGIDKRFESLETRFDGLETRFDGLETRFDGLETRFDGLETRFDGLETRFGKFEQKFHSFGTKFSEFGKKFDHLAAITIGMREDLKTKFATKDDMTEAENRVSKHIDILAVNAHEYIVENASNAVAHDKFGKRLGRLEEICNLPPMVFDDL